MKITKENAPSVISELRWKPDQLVENPHGEIVYLKQGDGFITDCCLAHDPCPKHTGDTNED